MSANINTSTVVTCLMKTATQGLLSVTMGHKSLTKIQGNLSLGTVVYAKSFTQRNTEFEKTFCSRLISGTVQVARQSNASHNRFLCSYPSINVCLFGINCYTELISCC